MSKTDIFRWAFRWLPYVPLRVLQYIAIGAGYVLWACATKTRERVRRNLAHIPSLAADPRALDRATRGCFRALMLNYVDLFHPPTDLAEVATQANASNDPNYVAVLKRFEEAGKGCILVSCHTSGFEWGRYRMPTLMSKPYLTPAEALAPPELFALVNSERAKSGIRFLPITAESTLREMIAALRRGENVLMAVDRDILQTGVVMPFFGAPARIATGPIALARLTGAPLIFALLWRTSLTDFEGRFFVGAEAISRDTRGDEAIRRALEPLIAMMEREIERHPDLWLAAFADDIWLTPEAVAVAQPVVARA
jgi:KDO2-lipid IV(A) lauroyltransferase